MGNLIAIVWMVFQNIGAGLLSLLFFAFAMTAYVIYAKQAVLEGAQSVRPMPIVKKVFHSTCIGILGTLVGCLLLMLLGVAVQEYQVETATMPSILMILLVTLVFGLMNYRLIDLVYSASVVSIVSLFFHKIDLFIPGVMALVGIVHIVRALLILVDGDSEFTPVLKRAANGEIVGGISFCRAWPMPFVVLLMISAAALSGKGIPTPAWWPLFHGSSASLAAIGVTMFPISLLVYFKEITYTKTMKQFLRSRAIWSVGFGTALLALSYFAVLFPLFAPALPFLALGGHEGMYRWLRKREKEQPGLFQNKSYGLRFFLVLSKSPAEKLGVEQGDILLRCNDIAVNKEEELKEILSRLPKSVTIAYEKLDGSIREQELVDIRGIAGLGAIFVPRRIIETPEGPVSSGVGRLTPVKKHKDIE